MKAAIIVEGKYDKNKVRQIFDTVVIDTGGFAIFNDLEKKALIKKLAEERGIVILSDSDGAGFVIRNHLKGIMKEGRVYHAYIPDIAGKERRKRTPSKEGKLGVEGVPDEAIIEAVRRSGVPFEDEQSSTYEEKRAVTKADFYTDALAGGQDSKKRRDALLRAYNLPLFLSANALLEMINVFSCYEEYKSKVSELDSY